MQPLLNESNEIVAIMAASRISASNLNYKVKKNKKSRNVKNAKTSNLEKG